MRLARSGAHRRRLEDTKELNSGLHRQIIQEIETARWKIALKEKESTKALGLAGEVQKNLLPRHHLTIGGLEVAGKNLPSHPIGGDYFDYLQHDPALVSLPSQDRFEMLKGEGLVLGVGRRGAYVTNVFGGLEEGQIIVIATGEIFEARDRHGDMFGHARLIDTIHSCCTESARQIVERVFEAVAAHV